MKNKKKIIISAVILLAAFAALFFLYRTFAPKSVQGNKEITVTVVHGDKTSKDFVYHTDEEYLGPVLQENNLVKGESGEYGLFITSADGETADDTKQQWWCITKDGEQVNTSADLTPIYDGDVYELTLTEGYDF